MFQAPEQMMAWSKSNLEATERFAGIALAGAERLFELQLKAVKTAFADSVQQIKTLSEIKDPKQFAQLDNTLLQPNLDKTTSYLRSIYDVASATQLEISTLIEGQVVEFNKQVVTSLDTIVKSAPAGSEPAIAAVKSTISALNSTYDSFSKSAKDVAEMTHASVEAATRQAAHVSKKKAA